MKPAQKRGNKKIGAPGEKKAVRLNVTLPDGLHKEAERLVEKFHFNGISDLFQHLVREAAFPAAHTAPTLLRDDKPPYRPNPDNDGKGKRPEGN